MGNRAIYSITENGETMYMYGQWAASHSLPFSFLQGVEAYEFDPEERLHLAEKIAALPAEPEQLVEIIDPARASDILCDFGTAANVAMHVEIDMDSGTVRFEHNALCYYQAPEDFSVTIDKGMENYIRDDTQKQEPNMQMDT